MGRGRASPTSTRTVTASSAATGDRDRPQRVPDRGGHRRRHEQRFTRLAGGAIRVEETVEIPDELADLARVGTVLETVPGPRAARVVRQRARTRPTRTGKRGGRVGRWQSTVADQHVPYIRPQENGGHADVRWLELARRAPAAASGSCSTGRARCRRPTSGRPTWRPRPTTSSWCRGPETIIHLDAAHRGLGTASCGPDTLPEYLVGPGTYRWAGRSSRSASADLPIDVDAGGPRVPPPQRPAQLHPPGPRQRGRSATSISGRRSPPGGRTRTSSRRRSTASRTASATRSPRVPDDRDAATTGSRRSSSSTPTARPSSSSPTRGHRIERRQAGDPGPALDLRRGRRRGRDARDRPRRRAERARRHARLHDLPRRAGRRPQRPHPERRQRPLRLARRDERVARPARRRLGARPPQRHVGPRAHVRTRRLEPGRQSVSSSARRVVRTSTTRSWRSAAPATTEDDGEAIGGRASSTRATSWPRPRSSRSGRPGSGSGSTPRRSRWTLAPGEEFATPEAVLVYSSDGLGAMSDAFHRLFRERLARGTWRDRPRPVLVNNWEGTYFDFDEDRLARDGDRRAGPRDRAVRPRRRLVRQARRRHDVARRLVRRPPQAARRHRRAGPRRSRRSA